MQVVLSVVILLLSQLRYDIQATIFTRIHIIISLFLHRPNNTIHWTIAKNSIEKETPQRRYEILTHVVGGGGNKVSSAASMSVSSYQLGLCRDNNKMAHHAILLPLRIGGQALRAAHRHRIGIASHAHHQPRSGERPRYHRRVDTHPDGHPEPKGAGARGHARGASRRAGRRGRAAGARNAARPRHRGGATRPVHVGHLPARHRPGHMRHLLPRRPVRGRPLHRPRRRMRSVQGGGVRPDRGVLGILVRDRHRLPIFELQARECIGHWRRCVDAMGRLGRSKFVHSVWGRGRGHGVDDWWYCDCNERRR